MSKEFDWGHWQDKLERSGMDADYARRETLHWKMKQGQPDFYGFENKEEVQDYFMYFALQAILFREKDSEQREEQPPQGV